MDIYDFISTNKEKYTDFLKNTFVEKYPVICDTASDILSSYLKVNYPANNVKFIEGLFNTDYHCRIEIDGNILDFTIIQFIADYDTTKPFVSKEYYSNYVKIREVEPSFIKFDNIDNFELFLSQLD